MNTPARFLAQRGRSSLNWWTIAAFGTPILLLTNRRLLMARLGYWRPRKTAVTILFTESRRRIRWLISFGIYWISRTIESNTRITFLNTKTTDLLSIKPTFSHCHRYGDNENA